MTNDEIICGALAPMGLPVAENVYRGAEEDYFVYTLIHEAPAVQADDEETETKAEYYVILFTRKPPGPMKRRAKALLKAAGIGVDSVNPVDYTDGTSERWQVAFDCFILNNEEAETDGV